MTGTERTAERPTLFTLGLNYLPLGQLVIGVAIIVLRSRPESFLRPCKN